MFSNVVFYHRAHSHPYLFILLHFDLCFVVSHY